MQYISALFKAEYSDWIFISNINYSEQYSVTKNILEQSTPHPPCSPTSILTLNLHLNSLRGRGGAGGGAQAIDEGSEKEQRFN